VPSAPDNKEREKITAAFAAALFGHLFAWPPKLRSGKAYALVFEPAF